MKSNIPNDLLREVSAGRAVLFLGAGASVGAKNPKGELIPQGKHLADLLAAEFLSRPAEDDSFPVIYDLCCSIRDTRSVQLFVADILSNFEPAPHHKLIPTIPWYSIASTNYDLIVERSYDAQSARLAELIPIRDDLDKIEGSVGQGKLTYLKLHGCVKRASQVNPPLIASTEQLIKFKEGRHAQFSTFMEWAKTKTIVFVGYKFGDSNLRTIFQEIIAAGDNRPTHYIVTPNPREEAFRYWANRRVELVDSKFESLIESLNSKVDRNSSKLGLVLTELSKTSFTKYVDQAGATESAMLKEYIVNGLQHLTDGVVIPEAKATGFYRGFNQGWAPIKQSLDIERGVGKDILQDEIIPKRAKSGPRFVAITGHAGSGKSVLLRRLAWDAYHDHQKMTFYVARENTISPAAFAEISKISSIEPYIFIDNVDEHRDELESLIAQLVKSKKSATIIGTSNTNIWNVSCQNLQALANEQYEMRYLSEKEIDELLAKLELHGSLGSLEGKTKDAQKEELSKIHGRQLLVALLEATNGAPLYDILAEEHKGILPVEARRLYLDICSLHRFGPPVRAGLISRLHDISFDDFRESLFKPLEQIVRLREDRKSGDVVYEARHSHIAHVVYEQAFQTEEEKFDNIVNLLSHLNSAFSYDLDVIYQIVKAENIRKTFSNKSRARQVYEVAVENVGSTVGILHQRAIFEMNSAINEKELDMATTVLESAMALEPRLKSLRHTEAEIALRRSRFSRDPIQREAYRRRAITLASELTMGASSPYPLHTILKAKIDRVKDVIDKGNSDDSVAFAEIDSAVSDAESSLASASRQFPNEAILVSEQGNLQSILAQSQKAEEAFRRAFIINPRSSLIAKKLALVCRARGAYSEAESVLEKALESSPGDRSLHNELALTIMQSAPNADIKRGDRVLYHLKRAYHQGTSDQQVKYWYARQLALAGEGDAASKLFAELGALKIPFADKTKVRGVVRDSAGEHVRYFGTVVVARETYALVEDDELKLKVFVPGRDLPVLPLNFGNRVSYELGFTLKGANCLNLKVD